MKISKNTATTIFGVLILIADVLFYFLSKFKEIDFSIKELIIVGLFGGFMLAAYTKWFRSLGEIFKGMIK